MNWTVSMAFVCLFSPHLYFSTTLRGRKSRSKTRVKEWLWEVTYPKSHSKFKVKLYHYDSLRQSLLLHLGWFSPEFPTTACFKSLFMAEVEEMACFLPPSLKDLPSSSEMSTLCIHTAWRTGHPALPTPGCAENWLHFCLFCSTRKKLCIVLQRKVMDSMMKGHCTISLTEVKCHKPLGKQCFKISVKQNVENPQKT